MLGPGPEVVKRVQSQTQNKVQSLAACGHVFASSQSLRIILNLRMNSSFTTSRPGPEVVKRVQSQTQNKVQ